MSNDQWIPVGNLGRVERMSARSLRQRLAAQYICTWMAVGFHFEVWGQIRHERFQPSAVFRLPCGRITGLLGDKQQCSCDSSMFKKTVSVKSLQTPQQDYRQWCCYSLCDSRYISSCGYQCSYVGILI